MPSASRVQRGQGAGTWGRGQGGRGVASPAGGLTGVGGSPPQRGSGRGLACSPSPEVSVCSSPLYKPEKNCTPGALPATCIPTHRQPGQMLSKTEFCLNAQKGDLGDRNLKQINMCGTGLLITAFNHGLRTEVISVGGRAGSTRGLFIRPRLRVSGLCAGDSGSGASVHSGGPALAAPPPSSPPPLFPGFSSPLPSLPQFLRL